MPTIQMQTAGCTGTVTVTITFGSNEAYDPTVMGEPVKLNVNPPDGDHDMAQDSGNPNKWTLDLGSLQLPNGTHTLTPKLFWSETGKMKSGTPDDVTCP